MNIIPVLNLPTLPSRPAEGHKGTFGKALLIAGSRGMSGAATLSGRGALRGGAGLVYVAVPEGIQSIVAASEPSYLTIGLNEDASGRIAITDTAAILQKMNQMSACGIGPGLGQSEGLLSLVRTIYEQTTCPLVVDADALNALARCPVTSLKPAGPRILTPHPGEFSRLTSLSIDVVQNNRSLLAIELAQKTGTCVVLKGEGTIVSDGQRIYQNTTGNSGMATGGSGDVLTGLITALLAQGLEIFEAAQIGVYLHGLAGDIAAAEVSLPGLIASDLPNYLGKAWLNATSKENS